MKLSSKGWQKRKSETYHTIPYAGKKGERIAREVHVTFTVLNIIQSKPESLIEQEDLSHVLT